MTPHHVATLLISTPRAASQRTASFRGVPAPGCGQERELRLRPPPLTAPPRFTAQRTAPRRPATFPMPAWAGAGSLVSTTCRYASHRCAPRHRATHCIAPRVSRPPFVGSGSLASIGATPRYASRRTSAPRIVSRRSQPGRLPCLGAPSPSPQRYALRRNATHLPSTHPIAAHCLQPCRSAFTRAAGPDNARPAMTSQR